jgi:hypothetical protein
MAIPRALLSAGNALSGILLRFCNIRGGPSIFGPAPLAWATFFQPPSCFPPQLLAAPRLHGVFRLRRRTTFPRTHILPRTNSQPNARLATADCCQAVAPESKSECRGITLLESFLESANMTHMSVRVTATAAASCLALVLASAADGVHAQCTTCATPTVAYSPVVAAAPVVAAPATVVVAPRMGLFDRLRLRRWGMAPTYTTAYAPAYTAAYAPTYTAAYAPAYTAAYAPSYTAAYAPAYTAAYAPAYTAAYAPAPRYLTSYAPLQSPVVQTSYLPVAPTCSTNYAPATACSACTTNYAPTAVLSPVVVEPPCSACSVAAPCGSCSACSAAAQVVESGYVGQASYDAAVAAPAAGCSSCATTSDGVQYSVPAGSNTGLGGGPATPTPAIENTTVPASGAGTVFPGPSDSGAFSAPSLLPPTNDRTASAPTVDIHTAVYRRPVGASSVSTAKPVQSSAPAADATPWITVTQ